MKKTYLALLIFFVGCNACEPKKKTSVDDTTASATDTATIENNSGEETGNVRVTPNEMATIIVNVLEELRTTLEGDNLVFSQAELKVAAKSQFSGEGGLSVKFANAKLSTEKETELVVTYQLKDLLKIARVETSSLKRLETILSNRDNLSQSEIKQKLRSESSQVPEGSELKIIKEKESIADARAVIQRAKTARVTAKRYVETESLLVTTVKNAIVEYRAMKQHFKQTCFDVEIGFSVTNTGTAGVDFEFVSGELSKGEGWEHSLTLSFGKCD